MDTGGKGKVTLDGAQETLMLTLLARAVDAESSDSILNDAFSVKIRDQIRDEYSYNFGARAAPALHLGHMAKMVSSRAKIFDEATERFLQQNLGPATVLHIACGMDTRCFRVKWQGPGRVWIDVDKKDVVELRRAVVENPEISEGQGEYRLEYCDIINDINWLDDIRVPNDKPVLIIFEGLVMYLFPSQVLGLVDKLLRHFERYGKGGQIFFDSAGPFWYYFLKIFPSQLRKMGAEFRFYMSNGKWLELHYPALHQINRELQGGVVSWIPYFWIFQAVAKLFNSFFGVSLAGGIYGFKF